MNPVCLVLPILPGKTDAARAFQNEANTTRKSEYTASQRRFGIPKEYWFIASTPGGDQLVCYFETDDVNRVMATFVGSQDPFERWFKRELLNCTGVDFNNPPPDMQLPELVSSYVA